MRIVLAVLLLVLLVIAHEWGHFITALKIGVPIQEFSVGFGPLLLQRMRGGVEYSLRLIPLGGFVRMTGEDEDWEDPDGFINRKPWEKILIAAAGPLMNFVAALVLFIVIYSCIGMPVANEEPVFGGVMEGGPAEAAGIRAEDRCLRVDGTEVYTWTEFSEQIAAAGAERPVELVLERGGEEITLQLQPLWDAENARPIIGVYSGVKYQKISVFQAVPAGFQQTWRMTVILADSMKMLFTGEAGMDDISGPVGITTIIGDAARQGMLDLLVLMAFLSVNLGLLNLLPIPALDGSKILFAAVEWVRGKRIDPEREATIHWIGFLILMGLMVLATVNDIGRFIEG